MAALRVSQVTPLPRSFAVGRGTALFVDGCCSHPDGRVRNLRVFVGDRETPVLASEMPSPLNLHRRDGDYWWAIVPIEPIESERTEWVGLRGYVNGREVSGRLGRLRLLPELPRPEPATEWPDVDSLDAVERDSAQPLVAIAMATFNPPADLFRRQLASIRAQTHRNWLCAISDDASAPESLAMIREEIGDDPRFLLSVSARRLGFYGNFERALTLVPEESDFVALSDQDDRWYPEKIATLLERMEPGVRLAYSDMRIVSDQGEILEETYWTYRRNNHSAFGSLVLANTVTGAAALFDRALLDFALPFPQALGNPYHDHWIAQVAMALGEMRYVDAPLYDYVQHGAAALGHYSANGSGRFGTAPRAKLRAGLNAYRNGRRGLGWRNLYFKLYCRVSLAIRVLELRCGPHLDPEHRRDLSRIADSPRGVAWLAKRALRSFGDQSETLGREQAMLAGLAWRRGASLRSRWRAFEGRVRPRAAPSAPRVDELTAAGPAATRPWLIPILVDYYTRDGSTLMMRLLASSPAIAVEEIYPFERKYFSYMWRWANLLEQRDWPEELWSRKDFGSLQQFEDSPLLGPPPWAPRSYLEAPAGEPPLGERAFELAWSEFSARLARKLRQDLREPGLELRYTAEKHLNTWAVDLDRLPPTRLIVLLRDPRDSWVSIKAFSEQRGKLPFGREHARDDDEHLQQFILRQRERLRWIAGLLEAGEVPVVRYEEMVNDLPAVAARIGAWLDVELDAAAAAGDERVSGRHVSAASPEASIGRWRDELTPEIADRINAELRPELRLLGFDGA